MDATFKELLSKGKKVSEARQKSTAQIKTEPDALLKEVAIPSTAIEIEFKEASPTLNGIGAVAT